MSRQSAALPEAPRNTYWRGGVLWADYKEGEERIRFSLNTADPVAAVARLKAARDPADPAAVKRKLARREPLTKDEQALVASAIDGMLIRRRQGRRRGTSA